MSQETKRDCEPKPTPSDKPPSVPLQPVVRPLPCPFCGSENIVVVEGTNYRWSVAQCQDCGAQCGEIRRREPQWPTDEKKAADEAEAIREWNIRSNPSHQGTTHLVRRTLDGVVQIPNQEK